MHTQGSSSRARAETNQLAHAAQAVVSPWLAERSLLLRLCLRWTRGDLAEAEDLLSDACLRILEGGECESEVRSPVAFWATVINNLGRDRLRHRRRWHFDYQRSDADALGALPTCTISAEQQMFLKECLAATDRQLTRLSERQRSAILLRSGGLGYSEIGAALCTSKANARKLVETARRALNAPRGLETPLAPGLATFRAPPQRSYLVGS